MAKEHSLVKGLLIDLDGVIYQGDAVLDGAADCLAWLESSGTPYLFVTNTTSRPRGAIVDKLAAMGVHTDADRILTPAVAAVDWLKQQGVTAISLFVPDATREEYAGFAIDGDEAGAVVVGDYGENWNFQTLNRAFRLLMRDPAPALVALGMTRYWRADDGLRLDTAPFVMALAHASGREPVVLGKPAPAFFHAALARLGVDASAACMVGDDVRTDVGAAQDIGIRGILVRTGKFRPGDLDAGIEPAAVLDGIGDLEGWWEAG